MQRHLFQTDVRTDEVFEFVGRDFPKPFETGDFRVGA